MPFDYEYFKDEVMNLIGVDLDLYKEGQMKRRIETLISRRGSNDYQDYVQLISNNPAELEIFADYITINVTEFFRDENHWQFLRQEVFPALVERFGSELTIWSCACSTGEEAYSLAMAASEFVSLDKLHIIATDIDEHALATARKGSFTKLSMETLSPQLAGRFFTTDGELFTAIDELRNCIEFRKLDLLRDAYPKGCHLIVCRNVLIYFTPQAKESIFDNFSESLVGDGWLFMGRTEQIVNWKRSAYVKVSSSFYRRETISTTTGSPSTSK